MRKLTLLSVFIFVTQLSMAQTYMSPDNGFQVQLSDMGFSINSDSSVIFFPKFMVNEPFDQYLIVGYPDTFELTIANTLVSCNVESATVKINNLPNGIESDCIDSICELTVGQWNDIHLTGTPTNYETTDMTLELNLVFSVNGDTIPYLDALIDTKLPIFRFQHRSIGGCTDPNACNFNPQASVDDGSCEPGLSATVTNYSYEHQKVKVNIDQGIDLTFIEYKWFKGTSPLGVYVSEFVPTQNGEYSVVVSDPTVLDEACSSDTINFSVTRLNRNELENMQIAIYPNPSKNDLQLVTGDSYQVLHIELVDMVGHVLSKRLLRNVSSNDAIHFDVNHLSPGLYFVKVSTDKDVTSIPWIKE